MDCCVMFAGNVGTDITYRTGVSATSGRWSLAEFRVGSTRRVRRRDGEWADGATTWMTVQCWGRLAEGVRDGVLKGQPVLVTGRLATDSWEDRNGEVRSRTVLVADIVGHDLGRGRGRFQRAVAVPEFEQAATWQTVPDPALSAPDADGATIPASLAHDPVDSAEPPAEEAPGDDYESVPEADAFTYFADMLGREPQLEPEPLA